MKTIPNYHPPSDYRRPTKTQEKVYVPVNDYPEINFSMITNPLTPNLHHHYVFFALARVEPMRTMLSSIHGSFLLTLLLAFLLSCSTDMTRLDTNTSLSFFSATLKLAYL